MIHHRCDFERDTDSLAFSAFRRGYQPKYPKLLDAFTHLRCESSAISSVSHDSLTKAQLSEAFSHSFKLPLLRWSQQPTEYANEIPLPCRIGVLFSGGPSPGGHNVLAGLLDGLASAGSGHELWGFWDGPSGLIHDRKFLITPELLAPFRNSGGFHFLGTGRTKIEKQSDLMRALAVLKDSGIQALVIIGGDDSNTNAAHLAEFFAQNNSGIAVVGVPKTIDADLQNDYVATTFGFDTAVKVYSEMISHIARDAASARKYYHFVRLMGRSASHITLEAALQTHPTAALIAEEIAAQEWSLRDVVLYLSRIIKERAENGLRHGVILVPEGLVEHIPEMKALVRDLNVWLATATVTPADISQNRPAILETMLPALSMDARRCFLSLPDDIQDQLLKERDPHGNVIVSAIETEKLLIELLEKELEEQRQQGHFQSSFGWQRHFLGYEGRCAAPTNFDADYAYALGRVAALLGVTKKNGYMAALEGLPKASTEWVPVGVPLASLLTYEWRSGHAKAVISKALVNLEGRAFKSFAAARQDWANEDCFRFSGPIQYFGPDALCDQRPLSLVDQSPGLR